MVYYNYKYNYPYKLQSLQQLLPDDAAKQIAFANWTLSKFGENPQGLLSILWTDEGHFSLHGTVNTHSCRIWVQENPHTCIEKPLHAPYITVRCGFISEIIVGPFSFEKPCARLGWKTCSVIRKRYLEKLRDEVIPCLEHNAIDKGIFM